MNLYDKNIIALQMRYPKLVEQLKNGDIAGYHLFEGEYGLNAYSVEKDAFYYNQNINQHVYDNLNTRVFDFARTVMFLGVGLGYEFLDYYHKHKEKKKTMVHILVEKDLELFKLSLSTSDFSEIFADPNVGLFVGYQTSELFNELSHFIMVAPRIFYVKSVEYVSSGSALSFELNYYKLAMQAMREAVTYSLVSYGDDYEDSLMGLKNMFLNIEEIVKNPGINELVGKFKGVPAIVASAGPSLDKSIEILKRCEGKAIIICPDTSLKILLNYGIKPNIFVSLERHDLTSIFLEGLKKEQEEGVQFLSCPVVSPKTYEAYKGPKLIMYRAINHFEWLEIDRGMLNAKQSAGNQAFKVADALGCDPIILVGQDLAFGSDGFTHATGAVTGEKHPYFAEVEQYMVKGNYVDQILTTDMWHNFLKGYIQDLADSNSHCINSTAGGAFIPGSTVLPFEDSYAQYIEPRPFNDYFQIITKNLEHFHQLSDAESIYTRLLNKFDKTEVYFSTLFDYLEYGKSLVKDYVNANNQPQIAEMVAKQIIELKNNIIGGGDNFNQLIILIIQSYFIHFEMDDALLEKDFEGVPLFHRYILRYEEWFERIDQMVHRVYDILVDSRKIVAEKCI